MGWYVEDIGGVVEVLTSRGVVFEGYDEPPIVTDGRGIATFEDGEKAAYFKDPDGHVLSLATGWGQPINGRHGGAVTGGSAQNSQNGRLIEWS